MKIRCASCLKELEGEEYQSSSSYELDNGESLYFCSGKKCQKRIPEQVETFEYEHTFEKDGTTYYVSGLEYSHTGKGGYHMYRMTAYFPRTYVSVYSNNRVWAKGDILTDLSEIPPTSKGVLHIYKGRITKR